MRGVGHTLSRLPAARAIIAGAAILAGSIPAGDAHAAGLSEDTAFANFRVTPGSLGGGLSGAGLPQPLSPSTAVTLRRIFAQQDLGLLAEAQAELALLDDTTLNGHILAQRYLGRFSAASDAELAEWLKRYPDHPDASAIHALLVSRLQLGSLPPFKPAGPPLPSEQAGSATPEDAESPSVVIKRNASVDRFIHKLARSGHADLALRMLSKVKGLDSVYGGQLRAELAQFLFTQGHDEQALHLARSVQQATAGRIALAGYVGGLAAWRLDRLDVALPLFEASARAETATVSSRAGALLWAARVNLRLHEAARARPLLQQAATARHTFYGLLARRMLGRHTTDRATRDTLGDADGAALLMTAQGRRALALLQIGQRTRAEAELRCLWPIVEDDAGQSGAVLRVAEAAGLTDLAAQLAGLIEASAGRSDDDARFPLPPLRPKGGFRVNPALVYALTRLESNFEPNVVSSEGARGLMQLMPVTASYMSGDNGTSLGLNTRRLQDPATNLALGQNYVLYLAKSDFVSDDLIRLLASWNAGPASLARMMGSIPQTDDPLLFIESIPNTETRGFVSRALSYTWIYAARLHLASPSLDELAAGTWPVFHAMTPRMEAARLN